MHSAFKVFCSLKKYLKKLYNNINIITIHYRIYKNCNIVIKIMYIC